MSDCFLRFSGTEGVPHCTPDEFMLAMIDHCKTQRIKTAVIDGQPWLIDVQLASDTVPLNHALTT